jgi:hypothetical protein
MTQVLGQLDELAAEHAEMAAHRRWQVMHFGFSRPSRVLDTSSEEYRDDNTFCARNAHAPGVRHHSLECFGCERVFDRWTFQA